MKVNFNHTFKDPFGNDLTDNEGKPQMINRSLGFELFNLGDLGTAPMSQEEKFMAYNLSMRIANSTGDIEISNEEAEFLCKIACRVYRPGAFGIIKSLIYNKNV